MQVSALKRQTTTPLVTGDSTLRKGVATAVSTPERGGTACTIHHTDVGIRENVTQVQACVREVVSQ